MLAREPANTQLKRKVELLVPLAARPVENGLTWSRQTTASEVSILVGVGGGIGDILHTTPLIRNLARRTGQRVDVIVVGDHSGSEFLVSNPEFVDRVWLPSLDVLSRRYETVFLTHSFGPMRFPFNADRVFAADEWQAFRPGCMHETLFNLEAAKNLLDIGYDAEDASAPFAGDLLYHPPVHPIVGIHAGSKQGRWLSKRWPYFSEMALSLTSRGIPVASFGSPDEYVEGTEDRTGGSLEQMSRSMLDCTFFLSNDSGPSHIASALGIPSLVLFAPTDPFTHLPLQASTVALALQKRCAPCEVKNRNHFASGQCRCIAEISVREVKERVMDLIKPPAPSTQGSPWHEEHLDARERGL
jgi:ADP-heptose:LPS heptosyltransferase